MIFFLFIYKASRKFIIIAKKLNAGAVTVICAPRLYLVSLLIIFTISKLLKAEKIKTIL